MKKKQFFEIKTKSTVIEKEISDISIDEAFFIDFANEKAYDELLQQLTKEINEAK